jgi:glucan phosphoethanolaminetransferase (alkaline phosphatase superfamily)
MHPPASAPATSRGITPVNYVLWAAFALILLSVGTYTVIDVHRRLSLDALLGLLEHVVRTGLYVSIGVFIEALLLRSVDGLITTSPRLRTLLHAFWVAVMFVALALVVDVFLFAFAGYHVPTGIRILFSGGPAGVGTVVEATGTRPSQVVRAVVGLVACLALAIYLSKTTRNLSRRWTMAIPRHRALRFILLSLGVLACLEAVSYRVRDPFLWDREVRRVPLAFALAKPEADFASFRVTLKKTPRARVDEAAIRAAQGRAKPDVFIVVIESLRKDVMTKAVMPRLAAFAEQSWTFSHPVTTGNVTHMSWYGLFCANYPIYFSVAKTDPHEQGSLPLKVLHRLGYRVDLLATPDTEYQNLERIVFGANGALLDRKFHPTDRTPPERDQHVIDELVRVVRAEPDGHRVRVVALDSTHYEYGWGAAFNPPFQPFANGPSITKNYREDAKARRLIENRYHNAAAWVDSLLGQFFDALAATGRLQSSIVIVTGDHGEAFGEHGPSTHGSDLGDEQLDVAFAMHLPGEMPQRFDKILSLIEIMPTVLYQLGYQPGVENAFAGVPLQEYLAAASSTSLASTEHALTFQGWNERTFRFALTYDDKRVLLELDRANPQESHRLRVKQVALLDANPGPLEPHDDASIYRQFLDDLPRIMQDLPFFDFE